jgi:hypothetical protein
MTHPCNRTTPEQPRRPAPRPPGRWGPSPVQKTPSRAEREQFVTQLLAALPAPGEEPVSTTQLGDRFQLDQYLRNYLLWASLDRLARAGVVERVVKEGEIVRYWRRAPTVEQQAEEAGPTP